MTEGRHVLVRRPRLPLNDFATRCAVHPTMVRRLVALGLVACERDARGDLWFEPSALATVGRIQRLRTGLGMNYAAIGLVLDLLDHIEELQTTIRRGRTSW